MKSHLRIFAKKLNELFCEINALLRRVYMSHGKHQKRHRVRANFKSRAELNDGGRNSMSSGFRRGLLVKMQEGTSEMTEMFCVLI